MSLFDVECQILVTMHSNKGRSEESFTDNVKLDDAVNPRGGARICDITVTHAELSLIYC